LTQAAVQRISQRSTREGVPMGWQAIGLIVLFLVAILALNRYEFGRFD
jgi:hypothetical protein